MTRTRRSFLHLLADHNPFYLLSAACMLLACLLLSNSTTWSPIGLRQLLMLIITLNVYEVLLVGLGLYLIVRRGIRRDGGILLVLEALFLVDVGFLSSETYQQSVRAGIYLNVILFALAIAKLYVVFRVLKLRVVSPAFGLVTISMAALLAMPGIFRHLSDARHGNLPDLAIYAAWWALFALMSGFAMVKRRGALTLPGAHRVAIPLAMTFLVLPLVSIAAHLGTSHWVYACIYRAPDITPVLLGLVMLIAVSSIARLPEVRALTLCMIGGAIWASMAPNPQLAFDLGWMRVRPIMIAAAAAYSVAVYCYFLRYALQMMLAGAAAAAAYVLGPSMETMETALLRAWRGLIAQLQALVPQTQQQWGVLSVVGAFVMLAIGAALSLFKGSRDDDASTPPPAPQAPTPFEPPLANVVDDDPPATAQVQM